MRWDIDLTQKIVRLRDPASGQQKLEFAARPILGCIGVAPDGELTPTSGPVGSYSGNQDYNEVREDATVLLPIYHSGALLYIGDGHALQGDGEPAGNGIETSLDVKFCVDLVKRAHLRGPRLEYLISVGAQPDFLSDPNRGLQAATTEMVRWLTEEYNWSRKSCWRFKASMTSSPSPAQWGSNNPQVLPAQEEVAPTLRSTPS